MNFLSSLFTLCYFFLYLKSVPIYVIVHVHEAHLQKDFVHDKNCLLAQVGSAGGSEGQHIVGKISSQVRGHEAGQPVQRQAGIVDVG